MKVLFQRPRPALPWAAVLPDYSFPSGHTMNAVVFYVALALILWSIARPPGRGWWRWRSPPSSPFGVGISRIYLGYHYLTDVVGDPGRARLAAGRGRGALRARPAWRQWRGPAIRRRREAGRAPIGRAVR